MIGCGLESGLPGLMQMIGNSDSLNLAGATAPELYYGDWWHFLPRRLVIRVLNPPIILVVGRYTLLVV